MADCECLPQCPFFNNKMKSLSAVADMLKRRLCLGDNSQCARYTIRKSLGKEAVPTTLAPNDLRGAQRILDIATAPR